MLLHSETSPRIAFSPFLRCSPWPPPGAHSSNSPVSGIRTLEPTGRRVRSVVLCFRLSHLLRDLRLQTLVFWLKSQPSTLRGRFTPSHQASSRQIRSPADHHDAPGGHAERICATMRCNSSTLPAAAIDVDDRNRAHTGTLRRRCTNGR